MPIFAPPINMPAITGEDPGHHRSALKRAASMTVRKPNLGGKVLIIYYHQFSNRDNRYERSLTHFKRDLETLHKMGFRPVTVTEYLSGKMPLKKGESPVILTFDDSSESQFRMKPDGSVDPASAVGVWDSFAEKHPDFPVRATWYVLPDVMWKQPEFTQDKVQYLIDSGSELASHTWNHPALRNLSDDQVKSQLGRSAEFLKKLGFSHPSLAYPYGIYPRHLGIVKQFKYRSQEYRYTGAVTVNPEPALPASSKKFKRYTIPRIGAIPGTYGLDWWLAKVRRGEVKVYVAK